MWTGILKYPVRFALNIFGKITWKNILEAINNWEEGMRKVDLYQETCVPGTTSILKSWSAGKRKRRESTRISCPILIQLGFKEIRDIHNYSTWAQKSEIKFVKLIKALSI